VRSDLITPQEGIDTASSQFVSAASLRVRLDWFNRLRWLAGLGVLGATTLTAGVMRLPLPAAELSILGAGLLLLNVGYVWRNHRLPPTDLAAEVRQVKLQMAGDLLILTVLLNQSGGIENPLHFVYLIHVILASLLLRGREVFQIALLAIVLFTGCAVAEYAGWLPHHHLPSASASAHEGAYVAFTLAAFWLVLLFAAYVGASIMRHNRAIKDELVARQERLIRADREKVNFFRFVTHEIKSPINTAQSAVETALEFGGGQLPHDVEDLLERAVGRLEQATDIVLNLADLTRGGDLHQEAPRDTDVARLAVLAAENLADQATRRGVRIETRVPDGPVVLRTSAAMTEKILANLVSNAVRYNREGGRVTVGVDDLGDRVRLRVADEGIGIEPEDRERIFDEFYRAPAAQGMSHLGTGLGLPIVKRFVELLGGTLALESTPGQGSTFTVELPRPAG
jgi:signal transduction histidine kinase